MNLKELKIWAEENYAKDNVQLMASGVLSNKMGKIKPHLKSIIEKSTWIISAIEKNNVLMNNIDNDIKLLSQWGLNRTIKEPISELVGSAKRDK